MNKKNLLKREQKSRRFKDGEIRDAVLKAWNKGEHSFEEVVQITGLKESQVNYYLPKETWK